MRRRQTSRGYTLVEVICAVVVAGIALGMLSLGTSNAATELSEADLRLRALLLAQQKLIDVETGATDPPQVAESGAFGEGDNRFSYEMTAADQVAGPNGQAIKEVRVRVFWLRAGKEMSVELTRWIQPDWRKSQ